MRAIIMAGGEGTRLRPVLPDLPKPMAPLLGLPLMQRIIELLRRCGVTDIRVTLRYLPEKIADYFGDGGKFGLRLSYQIEDKPLGTAGSVRACADFYGDRDFLVVSGDAACDFDLKALAECHRRHKNAATIALYERADPLRYGLVLTDSRGAVRSFIEKPAWGRVVTNRVNTGIYMLSPAAMALAPEHTRFDFAKDLFPALLARGERLMGLPMEGYWTDIGTPAAYYQCNLDALTGKLLLYGEGQDLLDDNVREYRRAPGRRNRVSISCRDRARLMRLLSESLMEAGADFSDGLTLNTEAGSVKVRPDDGHNAIVVESECPELRERVAGLARELNQ